MPCPLPALWTQIVDDAAVFPPGDVPLPAAVEAFQSRREEWYAGLVASFVIPDRMLPEVGPAGLALSLVIAGGAGGIVGPLSLAARQGCPVAGVEIALRDPDELAGNARRVVAAVDAARADGVLDDDTPVYVELPSVPPSAGWLAAADEIAAAELRLKFRTGGLDADLFPDAATLAGWIDAALDRETPFKCTAGLHHAVAHTDPATGSDHHGFLNVLIATRTSLDGGDAAAVLAERDPEHLTVAARDLAPSTRTWFTSFGSCSVTEPLEDLIALGLVEAP